MIKGLNKKLLLAMLALVVISNAWVLISVWNNRSEITASVVLSERELRLVNQTNQENNGVSLRIKYRVNSAVEEHRAYSHSPPEWLTKDKLLQLGFPEKQLDPTKQADVIKKEVFIALELDGDAYQVSLARAQERYDEAGQNKDSAENYIMAKLKRETFVNSRLFAIDAESDLQTLQQRYATKNNVFFVRGIVSSRSIYRPEIDGYVYGRINALSVPELYVTHPLNQQYADLPNRDHDDYQSSRYEVEVKFGKQLVPWIEDVSWSSD